MKRKSKARHSAPEGAQKSAAALSRKQYWLLGLLLVAATLIAYQPAWNAGFIWDDDDYVTHNPLLTAPDGWQRIWFSADSPSQYFPLVYTTFRFERALWGLNPAGYHWVNLLLHAVNALLAWRLLRRLKIPGAWLAAAIFALHPVNVESVAWITQLKNVQSLFFCLLAMLAWVEFVETDRHRGRWYGLTLLLYALALLSKTTACTLPAALLLILWLKRRPIQRNRIAQMVPFLMMGVAMGLVSMWWERHHQGTEGAIYSIPVLQRVLIASRAVWFYAGKLVWPANLTFNYPLWKISVTNPLAYVWLIAGAGACGLIYYLRRFAGRSVEVAALYYVATLSPLLGFIMLYTFRYTFVADHYQYAASLGPMALAAAALSWRAATSRQLPAQSKTPPNAGAPALRLAFSTALLITLAILTWRQCGMYQNLETLWQTTLARNPQSVMAHNNLGAVFLAKGRVDDAMMHFERALEIQPDHANAHGNLGNALVQKGQLDEALAHFQKAFDLEPNTAKSHSDLGFGLLQKGRNDEGIAHVRKALEIQPDFAEAHNHLGWVFLQNQPPEALAEFQKALEIQPDSADTCYNVGTAWLHNGRPDEAIVYFQKALAIRPEFGKAQNNLGSALLQSGQAGEAIAHLEKAVELEPNNVEARNNLGWVLLQSARINDAIAQLQLALKIQPNFVGARYNLGNAFFQAGRADDAMAEYQKVLAIQPDHAEVRNNLGWILLQSGRADEAIAQFQAVLKVRPDFAMVHGNLATALLRKGRADEAIVQYQAFLKLQPDSAPVLTALAWVLATWPDAAVRNGEQAVELAGRANQLTGDRDPTVLRTLAAAYAERGRFPDAVTTARRAREIAESQSNSTLRDMLLAQIQGYEAGSPFRDFSHTNFTAPAPPPPDPATKKSP